EEVARYMVEGFGGVITRMTEAQVDYTGVPADGPYKPDDYRY
ncbi:MAG: adenosylhomocysteinase, partial [Halomonas sp.]